MTVVCSYSLQKLQLTFYTCLLTKVDIAHIGIEHPESWNETCTQWRKATWNRQTEFGVNECDAQPWLHLLSMTPRQFSTPNFQFCVFGRIEGKVIVLWAHDATTKRPAKSAYYARQRCTEKYKLANISLCLSSPSARFTKKRHRYDSRCLTCTGRGRWRSWSSGQEAREGCRTGRPLGTCKG